MIFSFSFFPIEGIVVGVHYINSDNYPELFEQEVEQTHHSLQFFILIFGISIVWK
jgi:hypothetical protein